MATVTIGTVDYTTYADVVEADEYAAAAIHATAWRAADETTKEMALVTSTRLLDRQAWVGEKTDADQELEWPRSNTGVEGIEDDVVPQQVVDASIEIAIALVDGSQMQTQQSTANNIQSLRAGSVGITYFQGAEGSPLRFPLIVDELLRGLLVGSGGSGSGAGLSGAISTSVTCRKSVTYQSFGLLEPL